MGSSFIWCRKNLVKLLLHESQEVIAKIELDITSELGSLDIVDTVEEGRELTVHKTQNYEKVLERQRTNKWRKREVKEKGKQDNVCPGWNFEF